MNMNLHSQLSRLSTIDLITLIQEQKSIIEERIIEELKDIDSLIRYSDYDSKISQYRKYISDKNSNIDFYQLSIGEKEDYINVVVNTILTKMSEIKGEKVMEIDLENDFDLSGYEVMYYGSDYGNGNIHTGCVTHIDEDMCITLDDGECLQIDEVTDSNACLNDLYSILNEVDLDYYEQNLELIK